MYILLLAPRPAGKARATSIPGAVCKERATKPAGLSRSGKDASRACSGCSTMSPHRLRRGALHLPARRSRQNANLFLRDLRPVNQCPLSPRQKDLHFESRLAQHLRRELALLYGI